MKKMLILLCCCLSLTVSSQLPNGIIAPDFTATDLNGNSWHLYDLLDQGKSVVIHFAATWCGDCWDYHQSGPLNSLYAQYGPDGTNEMMVLLVEADDGTTLDDLNGTGPNTQGDWITGTPFPIIDDAAWLGNLYALDDVPRVYHICTNRVLTNAAGLGGWQIHNLHEGCLQPFGNYNAGILLYDGIPSDFCGEATFSPSVRFQNLGLETLTSATIQLSLNGTAAETRQYNGNLDRYEIAGIFFNPVTVTQATVVEIAITSVNGQVDEDFSNNLVSTDLPEAPSTSDNSLRVEILTDDYPGEIYWEILDDNGLVWYRGGNPGIFTDEELEGTYAAANTTYTHDVPLPSNGCWEFTIYDGYGDGICCGGGLGHYRLLEQSNFILLQGGVFTDEDHRPFSMNSGTTFNDNGAIRGYTGEAGDFCGVLEFTPSVDIQNLGANAINTLELQIRRGNETLQTTSWAGNLLPGQLGEVLLQPLVLDKTSALDIHITSVNGSPDTYDFANHFPVRLFRRKVEDNHITLQIQTDTWGWEAYWELQNAAGQAIASGGNEVIGPDGGGLRVAQLGDPGAYPSDTLITLDVSLPDSAAECYTLLMVDDWGDGFLDYGFYKIFDTNGQLLLNTRPIYTEASNLIDAQLGVSGSREQEAGSLQLYPNPVSNTLVLEYFLNENEPLQLVFLNAFGQRVQVPTPEQSGAGFQRLPIDVSGLGNGIYFLKIGDGERATVKRFVKF
ncbi:MAG: T9SS type A sorting domain-containing protein [Lewinellaceae bacterium]|nr:T9SS type A sorting domain-containing protein [Saprospiraceae bacterium]MCB9336868.1 T9SS type A sorting domain-containing protein [Lewinellaceae bacterium]